MKSYKFTLSLLAILFTVASVLVYYTEDDGFDNAVGRVLQMTDQGEVQYFEAIANGTDKIAVRAPASLSASSTITLPATAGSAGQFLQTDGAGNLAYANSSAATLDSTYDNGQSITADVGPLSITTSTNNQLLSLNQSAANSANVLQIANSGSGNSINVASGAVNFAGNATIGGNLSLTGNVATALAAASTLTVTGATTFNADATISGTNKLLFQSDTNLYRAAAAFLKTDHSLLVKGGKPWFDVRAFGATGDGTTDDKAAIQLAFDACAANGGIIFFPVGNYKIDQSRIIHSSIKPIAIIGCGWNSLLTWVQATDTPAQDKGMINISGTGDTTRCAGVLIADLAFDFGSNRAAGALENKRGINIYQTDNIILRGCYFKGAQHEMVGLGNFGDGGDPTNAPGYRSFISECYFFDCAQVALNPNSYNSNISNCIFKQCSTGIEAGRAYLTVNNNQFDDVHGSAIKISSVDSFTVFGNRIIDSPTQDLGFIQGAIYVVGGGSTASSRYGVISGNSIFENTAVANQIGIAAGKGTSTDEPEDIFIIGNIVRGAKNAIYVNHGFKVQVISNYAVGGTGCTTGIALADTTDTNNCTVVGNHVVDTWSTGTYGPLPASGANNMQYNNHDALGMLDLQLVANHGTAPGTKLKRYLSATATYDAPNLVAVGDITATTVTVTGAVTGDLTTVALSTIGANNVSITSNVSAADTVRVVLKNEQGANLDLASGTLRVGVWKH